MIYIIYSFLLMTLIRNAPYPDRLLTAAIVALITSISYYIYYMGPYEVLVEYIGYWGYLSIAPTISIFILAVIRGPMATALMLLFLILMAVHIACFFLDGYIDIEPAYQYIAWLFFGLEIIIMLSRRASHGLVRLFDKVADSLNLGGLPFHHMPKNSAR